MKKVFISYEGQDDRVFNFCLRSIADKKRIGDLRVTKVTAPHYEAAERYAQVSALAYLKGSRVELVKHEHKDREAKALGLGIIIVCVLAGAYLLSTIEFFN